MSEAPHILVVDDDQRIRDLLQSYLRENGFRVTAAGAAKEARERMRGLEFDAAVVDVMMPGESGLEFTRALREERQGIPILVLSALTDTGDRIGGLEAGGDDYLGKPFEPRELVLRIRNLLKRNGWKGGSGIAVRFGDFIFNPQRGELLREGKPVRLTTRERDFLRLLSRQPGEAVSRDEFSQPGSEQSARAVDVQINRLRQKIEADPANPVFLQTVRGAGYCLMADG
jgi:two-component system phosphate regulon response regulator OmpR